MKTERLLGWCGLLLIGLIGVAYRLHDWALGAPRDRELSRAARRLRS